MQYDLIMARDSAPTMTTRLSKPLGNGLMLGASVAVLLLVLSVLLLPAVSATSVPSYPVKLTASPKSHTYHVGDSPKITLTEKNTGSSTFKATGCVVEIKYPGATTYSKSSCPNFKTFSVGAGKTAKQTYSLYPYKITSSTPKGTYDCKAYFTGKVGTTSYVTKTVSFTATVA